MATSTINKTEIKELIWSGSGSRGEETLVSNKDLTKYSEIEIWVQPWTSGGAVPYRMGIGATQRFDCVRSPYLATRRFTTTTNSISCAVGRVCTAYGTETFSDNNTACVPVKIYGIR